MTNIVQPTGIGRMSATIAMAARPQSGEDGRGETATTLIDALSAARHLIAIGLVIYFLYGRFRSRLRTM
jgi:NhaP-type Na+/H+ or K+/H+ antiporter